jgi:RNA polymerase sigma factor (sigma-70 family)
MVGSVTRWLQMLRDGGSAARNEAAEQIWLRYCHQLLSLVRRRLSTRIRRREDEDDVLQQMYLSFCTRQARNEFQLHDRTGLWNILLTLTLRKVADTIRRQTAAKRNPSREQPRQAVDDSCAGSGEEEFPSPTEPSPMEVAAFTEELEHLLRRLDRPLFREVACLKILGYTNAEIAAKLDCTVRTVERKLSGIRERWQGHGR